MPARLTSQFGQEVESELKLFYKAKLSFFILGTLDTLIAAMPHHGIIPC